MSAIKEFNSLGGKTVTRKELNDLVNKAHDEKSWEVHKRVLAILDKHKEANEFEFAKNAISPIKETSKLGIPVKLKVYSKEIDGNLVFFYGEKMLATIRPNGLIQYETSRLPRGARNTIRKASNEFAKSEMLATPETTENKASKTETKKPKTVTKKAETVTKKSKTVTKNAQTPKKPTNKVVKDTSKVEESNKRVSVKNVDNRQKSSTKDELKPKKTPEKSIKYKIDKKKFPLKMIYDEIPSGIKVRIKKHYINAGRIGIVKIHNYAKTVKNYDYPFESQIEFLDGTVDWVKPWAYEKLKNKSKTTTRKKPVHKSVLANPQSIVDEIEVIEPNPVIPFVAQIPEEKEEVLDQVNTPKTSLPTQKKSRLMSMTFETLPMKGKFANLMQHPAKNLKIGIFGKPKNGKTGGSLQLAEYLTQFGNVLYNFADQGFNLSTQKLWKESGLANYPEDVAYPSDVTTLDELEKEIATGNYQFVFIDLINDYIDKEKVTPQEFKDRFIRKYDNIGFILVFESTKSGDFKGDQKWMHVVDAIANVEDFVMTMRGRYGNGEFLIWEQGLKDVNPAKYQEWLEKYSETIEPENLEFSDEIETI